MHRYFPFFVHHYLPKIVHIYLPVTYPNKTIFLSKDKVENAMKIAKEIRTLVAGKMGINIDYNKIIDDE